MKKGKIDISALDSPPEPHEMATAQFFADLGYDIYFLPKSKIKGVHRGDFVMCHVEWETKSPTGNSEGTLEKRIKEATKQSDRIIIDFRRTHLPEDRCMAKLKKEIQMKRSIKRLLVITHTGSLVEIKKTGVDILVDGSKIKTED